MGESGSEKERDATIIVVQKIIGSLPVPVPVGSVILCVKNKHKPLT